MMIFTDDTMLGDTMHLSDSLRTHNSVSGNAEPYVVEQPLLEQLTVNAALQGAVSYLFANQNANPERFIGVFSPTLHEWTHLRGLL